MTTAALCLLVVLCTTLAGCIVIPERHHWWHEHRDYGEATMVVPQPSAG